MHHGLSNAGLDVVLMETRQVKGALKAMPIKTDRRDAEGIARLLHLGWFRPVHCKSVSAQEVRAVLGARKAVQQGFIALEMSLRGLLRNFGLKVGTISRGRFEYRIRELAAGNPMLEAATEPMLRARASLRKELAGLERSVRLLAQDDPVCRRLMSMPGIGAIVALTYRSAVDDPARFTSPKKVGPWAGLTPSRNQSGERDVSGGITKAGDVNLRRALCQAATVMMNRGRSTWLRTWAAQVARRRGGKRAMVMKVATTLSIAMRGSGFTLPSACGTPPIILAVMSEATLPMSIWPTAMSKARPSSEAAFVMPVMACLLVV